MRQSRQEISNRPGPWLREESEVRAQFPRSASPDRAPEYRFHCDTIVLKMQNRVSVRVIVDLGFVAVQQQAVLLTRKIVAPQTSLTADREIGVLALSRPGKQSWRVETNSLFAERDFAGFQNNQKNEIAKPSREQRTNCGRDSRIRTHQFRHGEAGDKSRDRPTDRHLVRNDEVFEIDKRGDDNERNKNPVSQRHLPRKALPDREKEQGGKQLHGEITKCDFAAAVCAAAAQQKPAEQREILMPEDRLLAIRAKRAARLTDGLIARQPVNADVQERANGGAKNKCERAEEKVVERIVPAITRRSRSRAMHDAPSTTRSRCSFRKAGTSEVPSRSELTGPAPGR